MIFQNLSLITCDNPDRCQFLVYPVFQDSRQVTDLIFSMRHGCNTWLFAVSVKNLRHLGTLAVCGGGGSFLFSKLMVALIRSPCKKLVIESATLEDLDGDFGLC